MFDYFVVPLICTKKIFITKQIQRGRGGWGEKYRFAEGHNPIYDSVRFMHQTFMKFKGLLRYHKPYLADYIVYLHPKMCTVVHKLLLSFCCIISHTSSEHFTQLVKIYTPYGGVNLWLSVS